MILVESSINIIFASGYETSTTIKTDRDTYVDSGWSYDEYEDRDSNFGGKDWFLIGQSLGKEESYFHFDLSAIPAGATIKKAEASFYIYSVDETMNIRACTTAISWQETSLTWNNKPSYGTTITTFEASRKDYYVVDITKYIESSEISICLYAPTPPSYGDCQGSTKEGAYGDDETPHIDITYEVTSALSGGIVIVIVIGFAVMGILGVIIVIIYKRSKKSKKQVAVQPPFVQPQPPPVPPQPPVQPSLVQPTVPQVKICPYCGSSQPLTVSYCMSCGSKLD